MVEVKINDESFAYDIHSLIQAFYGGEEVQVRVEMCIRDRYETVLPSKEALQKLLEEQLSDENGSEDDDTYEI